MQEKSIDAMKSLTYGDYERMYAESVNEPEKFWAEQAQSISWYKKWDKVLANNFADAKHEWFINGKLNACYNCLDRHVEQGRGDDVAIIWEGDDASESSKHTYGELLKSVSRFSNVLKKNGVKKGDLVTIYMPMVIEQVIAVLACARIGAIHSVVFGGFSPASLETRITDCNSRFLITADEGIRGNKTIPLKNNIDEALKNLGDLVQACIVVKRTGGQLGSWVAGRDKWWHEEMNASDISDDCPPAEMDAEDPLFILYTSGSTGKPKALMHTTGGYMVYVNRTFRYSFDYRHGEVYWCTADIGWITGHSYLIYGPLSNGAISLMFEGVPNYPDAGRFWDVVDKHSVNIFYTAPTAIRALMREGDSFVTRSSRKSLRILATVGEPINPEAWNWYHRVIGNSNIPIIDTWWQTETGGHMITPLPGVTKLKAGSATLPSFGVQPVLLDNDGGLIEGEGSGCLCIKHPWPGLARGIYNSDDRFKEVYFSRFPGYYFTGDGARRDADGYYWITGRIDDVLNVSGHRLSTAEVESALVAHSAVAEAAVVGFPHEIKGQGVYAYVTLMQGREGSEELAVELNNAVRKDIGPIAKLDHIQWAPGLPKTRSGKIMRRILRKIAENELSSLGDTSTLADPQVVDDLIKNRLDA